MKNDETVVNKVSDEMLRMKSDDKFGKIPKRQQKGIIRIIPNLCYCRNVL